MKVILFHLDFKFNRVCRLGDYEDLIPVKETSNVAACSVCKPRSLSPFPATVIQHHHHRQLNTSLPSTIPQVSPSRSNNAPMSQSPTRRRASLSPPPRRSRSWDQSISTAAAINQSPRAASAGRKSHVKTTGEADFLTPKREFLVEKLVETESYAGEIAKHLAYLRDHLNVQSHDLIAHAPYVVDQLENDRNRLIDLIDLFNQAGDDLKSAVYDWAHPKTMDFLRQQQENDFLVKQLDTLEMENNVNKLILIQQKNNSRVFFKFFYL